MRVRDMAEYSIWCDMRRRCSDPARNSYKNYGARGITVCARWDSFKTFLADMGPRPSKKHSLERVCNDGNYEPSNCRWATKIEQSLNKSSNLIVTAFGRTGPLGSFISAHAGRGKAARDYKRVWERIRLRGWDVERALTAPLDNRGARAI